MSTTDDTISPHTHASDFLRHGTRLLESQNLSKDEAHCPVCKETYTECLKYGSPCLEIAACRHKFCEISLIQHFIAGQPNSNKCPLCRMELFIANIQNPPSGRRPFTTGRVLTPWQRHLNEATLTDWRRTLAVFDGEREPPWGHAVHFEERHDGHVNVTLSRYGTNLQLRLQGSDVASLGQMLVEFYHFRCRAEGRRPLPVGEDPESELLLSYHNNPYDGTVEYEQQWALSLADEDSPEMDEPFDGQHEPSWSRRARFFGYPRLGYVECWFMRRRGEVERSFLYCNGDAKNEMLSRLYHFRCCGRRLEPIPLLRGVASGMRTVTYDDGSIASDSMAPDSESAMADRADEMAQHAAAVIEPLRIAERGIQQRGVEFVSTRPVLGATMSYPTASSNETSGDNGGTQGGGGSAFDWEQLWESLFPFTIV